MLGLTAMMSFGVAGRAVTGAAGAVTGVAVVLLPVSLVVPVVLVFLLLLSPLLVQVVVCATRSAPMMPCAPGRGFLSRFQHSATIGRASVRCSATQAPALTETTIRVRGHCAYTDLVAARIDSPYPAAHGRNRAPRPRLQPPSLAHGGAWIGTLVLRSRSWRCSCRAT